MKLVVLLDEKDYGAFEEYKDSCFLINDSSLYKKAKNKDLDCVFFNVRALYSSSDTKTLDKYASIVKDISNANKILEPVLDFGYLRVQLPIMMMYQQIEALIREKSIKQIVLFGGSEYTLLPSFGGEGEGKSVLYKASWFYNSIKDVIPKALGPNTSIISDMTLGLDIFALNQVCRELGYKHINYQYVSMAPLSLPIYEMADEYYIYSKETFDLYSQKSSIFKRYMILKRDPELPLKITRITLFLQPDEYTQSYIDFLGELCDLYYTRNAEFQIFIKPHPRQDRVNEFDNYVKQYPFLKWTKKDLSADEAIKSTDIVISILSTTLYEAFTFGTIGVICNYKEMYTDVVTTEACCSEVNFMITNASDLYDLIDDYEKTREDYLNRYYKFLERINNQ